ncbi:MAG: hypothetical protein KDK23_10450 [Leptospiraceae bacterium]|nr:hypothetical protein [Leptospiraceae bacterium]
MDNEMKEFVAEGMKRYKEASRIMVLFGKSVKGELQDILSSRKNWGPFTPGETRKTRSTTFWHDYPLLNADIFGSISGKDVTIRVAVNWYQSESEYPFYSVSLESGYTEEHVQRFLNLAPETEGIFAIDRGLAFRPEPDDFDLRRDFDLLIDGFVEVLTDSGVLPG